MKKRKWHKITAALATVAVILSSPGITDLVKGSSTEFVDIVPISEVKTKKTSQERQKTSQIQQKIFLKQQRNLKRISEVKQPPRKVRKIKKQTV